MKMNCILLLLRRLFSWQYYSYIVGEISPNTKIWKRKKGEKLNNLLKRALKDNWLLCQKNLEIKCDCFSRAL